MRFGKYRAHRIRGVNDEEKLTFLCDNACEMVQIDLIVFVGSKLVMDDFHAHSGCYFLVDRVTYFRHQDLIARVSEAHQSNQQSLIDPMLDDNMVGSDCILRFVQFKNSLAGGWNSVSQCISMIARIRDSFPHDLVPGFRHLEFIVAIGCWITTQEMNFRFLFVCAAEWDLIKVIAEGMTEF